MNEFESYVDSIHYKKFDRKKLLKLLSQYLIELSVRRELAKDARDLHRLKNRVQMICALVEVLSDETDYLK